jgi:hypothetical protein
VDLEKIRHQIYREPSTGIPEMVQQPPPWWEELPRRQPKEAFCG